MTNNVIHCKNSNVIGAYNVFMSKRSEFKYSTVGVCEGFSIRKSNWIKIINENTFISDELKDKIIKDYVINIRKKVLKEKEAARIKLLTRADY
jgi:hypothetical protein